VRGDRTVKVTLEMPERSAKPRDRGLTAIIDPGLPTTAFRDAVGSTVSYIDLVKFGWGTALATPEILAKIELLQSREIPYYLGGTLFEKYVLQDRFDDFKALCRELSCSHIEVSNGTIGISNTEKAGYISRLAEEFTIISEVGFKDPTRSAAMAPAEWIACCREDLAAGASLVTLEARESGRSGVCRPDGRLRDGLIAAIATSGIDLDHLLFEAPTTELQAAFVRQLGPEVNLANIAATSVIGLETLRLGLRSDTLTAFDPHIRCEMVAS
jgi:phosphosulfolactate synthase